MKINGSWTINGWRTVMDLQVGDVFCYEDNDKELYMRTDMGFLNLLDGAYFDLDDIAYEPEGTNPVRTVACHIEVDE